jgi:hypothetical protein
MTPKIRVVSSPNETNLKGMFGNSLAEAERRPNPSVCVHFALAAEKEALQQFSSATQQAQQCLSVQHCLPSVTSYFKIKVRQAKGEEL